MDTRHGPMKMLADGYRESASSDTLWNDTKAYSLVRADNADDLLRALDNPEKMYDRPEGFHETQTGKHSVRFHWGDEGLVSIEIVRIDGEPLLFSDLRDSSEFPMSWLLQQDAEAMHDAPLPPSFHGRIEEAKRRYRQGKSPMTAEHLAAVALLYSKVLQRHGRAPIKAVADEFKVPNETAKNWIRKCRKEGFLPPTEERRPKGYLR